MLGRGQVVLTLKTELAYLVLRYSYCASSTYITSSNSYTQYNTLTSYYRTHLTTRHKTQHTLHQDEISTTIDVHVCMLKTAPTEKAYFNIFLKLLILLILAVKVKVSLEPAMKAQRVVEV